VTHEIGKWNYMDHIELIPKKFRTGAARRRFKRQFGTCFICENPLDMTTNRDHFIPRAQGGHGAWKNCVLTHERCNNMKGNTIPTIPYLVKFKMVTGRWPITWAGGLEDIYSKKELELAEKIYDKIHNANGDGATNIRGRSYEGLE